MLKEAFREKERGINFDRPWNKLILELADRGYSVSCIQREVNKKLGASAMSECQVYYRIRKGGTTLKSVRNGNTVKAREDIDRIVVKLYFKPQSAKKKVV